MITERDLDEAIAKCQGESNPTNSTCMKLAAFLTIKDYLYPQYEKPYPQYSYASEPEPVENTVNYNSDAEFFRLANGMEYDKVWKIIAELMETLQVINPRLYAGVIKKLKAQ